MYYEIKKRRKIYTLFKGKAIPLLLSPWLLPPPHLNLKKEVLDRSKWDLLKTALDNLVYNQK